MDRFLSYIKFLFKSKNQHGVHSPFVFNLVTQCFYDRRPHAAYEIIQRYRKKMLQNRNSISITDFGAGSKVFTSEERKIAAIAWSSGITPKRGRLMNRLVRYLNIKNALELGTSVGMGSVSMAAGNDITITTIEGCPEIAKVAGEQFKEFGFENIDLKVSEFDTILFEEERRKSRSENDAEEKEQRKRNRENTESQISDSSSQRALSNHKKQATNNRQSQIFDLIFIDGNHQKDPTLKYFNQLLSAVHNDSVVIFDDIHWSREMEEAWEEIKLHPEVTVTIDTFHWGMVFFRREQAKEHFVIRV